MATSKRRPNSGKTNSSKTNSSKNNSSDTNAKKKSASGSNGRTTPPGTRPPRSAAASRARLRADKCECGVCEAERLGVPYDYEAAHRREEANIQQYGMTIQYVSDPDWPWAYTIGRLRAGLPELIVTGLAPAPTASLLNTVHQSWDDLAVADGYIHVPMFESVALVHVPDAVWDSEFLLGAQRDAELQEITAHRMAVQLVWADRNGDYPWDTVAAHCQCEWQPIVGLEIVDRGASQNSFRGRGG